MSYRYRRFSKYDYGRHRAAQHIAERQDLSRSLGGIDKDVEQIFLNLPPVKLESVFLQYGRDYGASPLSYAREAYPRWKSGAVRMSGVVAGRLLNLVPLALDASTRFDLVKKLRAAHMHKERRDVTCEPNDWRSKVPPVVAELLMVSQRFQLPQHAVDRVRWLAEDDADSAQRLLAAAEQEEAVVRLRFLEDEFRRIDFLLQSIETTKFVRHTIELPQGTINVLIITPKRSFWRRLGDLLS